MNDDLFWIERAACRGSDTDMFYDGTNAKAKRICNRCPVRSQCLLYGIDTDERLGVSFGIWGGMDGEERDQLRREVGGTL